MIKEQIMQRLLVIMSNLSTKLVALCCTLKIQEPASTFAALSFALYHSTLKCIRHPEFIAKSLWILASPLLIFLAEHPMHRAQLYILTFLSVRKARAIIILKGIFHMNIQLEPNGSHPFISLKSLDRK